jgi:hypothetical protein
MLSAWGVILVRSKPYLSNLESTLVIRLIGNRLSAVVAIDYLPRSGEILPTTVHTLV